jgi:hypothetical protein
VIEERMNLQRLKVPNRNTNIMSANTASILEAVKRASQSTQPITKVDQVKIQESENRERISLKNATASGFTEMRNGLYKEAYKNVDYGKIWIKKEFVNEKTGEKEEWLVKYTNDDDEVVRHIASSGMNKVASLDTDESHEQTKRDKSEVIKMATNQSIAEEIVKTAMDFSVYQKYPQYKKYFTALLDLMNPPYSYGHGTVADSGAEYLTSKFPEVDEVEASKILNVYLGEMAPYEETEDSYRNSSKIAANVDPKKVPIAEGVTTKNITMDQGGAGGTAKVTFEFSDPAKGLKFYQDQFSGGKEKVEAPNEEETSEEEESNKTPQGLPQMQSQVQTPQQGVQLSQPKASSLNKKSEKSFDSIDGVAITLNEIFEDAGEYRINWEEIKQVLKNAKEEFPLSQVIQVIQNGDYEIENKQKMLKIVKSSNLKIGEYLKKADYYDNQAEDQYGQILVEGDRAKLQDGRRVEIVSIDRDNIKVVTVERDQPVGTPFLVNAESLTKWASSTVSEFSDLYKGIKVYRTNMEDSTFAGNPWKLASREGANKKVVSKFSKFSFVNENGIEIPLTLSPSIKVGSLFERPDTHEVARFAGFIDRVATSLDEDGEEVYNEPKLRKLIKDNVCESSEYWARNGADSASDVTSNYSWSNVTEMDGIGDYLLNLASSDKQKAKVILKEYAMKAAQEFNEYLKTSSSKIAVKDNEEPEDDYNKGDGEDFEATSDNEEASVDIHIEADPKTIEDILDSVLEGTNVGDKLPGGKGDNKSDEDFDPEELEKGKKVEKEHTDDSELADEIAKDHLTEMDDYYDKLEDMENKEKKKESSLNKTALDLDEVLGNTYKNEEDIDDPDAYEVYFSEGYIELIKNDRIVHQYKYPEDMESAPISGEESSEVNGVYYNSMDNYLEFYENKRVLFTLSFNRSAKVASLNKVAKIVHENGKWLVKNEAGTKTLGTHDTEEEATKQLQAIEINKHKASLEKSTVEKYLHKASSLNKSGDLGKPGALKLYLVPISGNERFPRGGEFFVGTRDEIKSKLQKSEDLDSEEAEELLQKTTANSMTVKGLYIYDQDDSEGLVLGRESTPNSEFILAINDAFSEGGNEDMYASKKINSNLNKLSFNDPYEGQDDFTDYRDQDEFLQSKTESISVGDSVKVDNDPFDEVGTVVEKDEEGNCLIEMPSGDTIPYHTDQLIKVAAEEESLEIGEGDFHPEDNSIEHYLSQRNREYREQSLPVKIDMLVDDLISKFNYSPELSRKLVKDFINNKISSKIAADISDQIPPMSLTTDESKSDKPDSNAQPLPPKQNLNDNPGDVLYDSNKVQQNGGPDQFQTIVNPQEKSVTVKFLDNDQEDALNQALHSGVGTSPSSQPQQTPPLPQPNQSGVPPVKTFEESNSGVQY